MEESLEEKAQSSKDMENLRKLILKVASVITSQDISSPKVFKDSTSPQYKALRWMAQKELDGPT